ncbi:dockerin type I domain-containing protein [Prevotella sp.]|uniref:dockerin type I domain-containing protein n=1 Tax=Prevotella sp. TaxID=59823 RepID=UPI003AB5AD25
MRKNVLVSLLAVTSASTMPAWANADVDQIKTDAATDWEGASDLEIESGLIVSPSGATVTQNIGKLYPGTYTLTAETNENAKILIDGKELAANGQFKIDAVKDVTISIESKDGSQYKVGGFKLTLVYNFANAKSVLTSMLSEATSKIYTEDEAGKALLQKASSLATKVAAIADDKEDSYAKYIEYGLYAETLEESAIYNEIAEFSKDVDAQANNSSAYAEAEKVYEAQKAALATAKAAVDAITDAKAKAYVDAMTKGAYGTISEKIETYKTEADAAYAKGTAGKEFSAEKNAEFVGDVTDLLKEYSDAIESAKADHAAYVEVSEAIATIKTLYTTSQQEIYNSLQGDETHPDVYEALRTEAQTKLNAIYVNIMAVEKANGTDENHVGAAAAKDDNLAKLDEYTASITDLKTYYVDKANALKEAYTNAQAKLKGLQDRIDALKNTPGVGDNADFTETINEIQASIDAFSGTIEADNKDNTIDSKNYSETVSKISTAIDELTSGSQGAVDNYNAWGAVTDLLKDKQKEFDDAKKVVNALVSTDKKYVVSGKYAAEETAIQKSIADLTKGADEALKYGTCVEYQTENTAAINAISATVDAYQQAAEAALAAYETIVTKVAEYNEAIAELEEKVTNRSVYVYAESTDQKKVTYGDKIDGFKATVKNITGAKDEALELAGKEHSDALIAAKNKTNDVTIVADVAKLVGSYDKDKTTYDEDVVDIALEKLLAQATGLVKGAYDIINAYSWSQDELGLSHGDINNKKAAIEAELREQESKIESAKTESDKAAAMAVLTSVTTEVSKINTKIGELINEADGVKAKVQANKDAKTAADKVINGIETQLLGNRSTIKGVEELNEDALRADEFTDMVNDLNGKIGELRQAVNDAYTSETLVAAWADSEDEEGNKVEGLESKLNAISADVEAAREAAQASTANYKAYTEMSKEITRLKGLITTEKAKVGELGDLGAAQTYYDDLLDVTYTGDLDKLQDGADNAYSEEGKRDCENFYNSKKATLKLYETNITKVASDAKANKENYDNQTAKHTTVSDSWSKVYYRISTSDQTSEVQGYLNRLTEQQTLLNGVTNLIDESYATGKSVDKNDEIIESLKNISAEIDKINQEQLGGYYGAVAKDNAERYLAFTEAVAKARADYNNAIILIADFSALTNSDLAKVAADYIKSANEAMSGLLTDLRDFEKTVSTEYNKYLETAEPDLFDANESYKKKVETDYIGVIATALSTLDNEVSGKARELLNVKLADAEGKLNAAIASLNGYDQKVIEGSFTDVKKIIADAKNASDEKYFALSADKHLNALDTVTDEVISAGQEDAAQREYNTIIAAAEKQIAADKETLAGYKYEGVENDIKAYEEQAVIYYGFAKERAEANIGNLFEHMTTIKAWLGVYKSTAESICNSAKAKNDNFNAEQGAYGEMMQGVADLEKAHAEAAKFVDGYVITDDCGLTDAMSRIDELRTAIENNLSAGTCASYKEDGYASDSLSVINNIKNVYTKANTKESERLTAEIEALKGEQNKAANAAQQRGDAAEIEKVDSYIDAIKELSVNLIDMEADPNFSALDAKDKQREYLEFETRIATMRSELAAYYNANLETTTIETLNSALAEVESKYNAEYKVLNGCHTNVKADYTEALAAVKTSIDDIRAEIAEYAEAGSILFYEGKLSTGIAAVETELAKLTQDIADAQTPYTINDAKYVELKAELDSLEASLNAVVEKISKYEFFDIKQYQYYIEGVRSYINYDRQTLEEANGTFSLTESSENVNKSVVELYIADLDKYATYYELEQRISNSVNESGLSALYDKVSNIIANSKYTEETRNELTTERNRLSNLIAWLYNYNSEAYTGFVYNDLDGNPLFDAETGIQGVAIDYMTEAVPAVWERYGELAEQLNSLKADAEGYAYILGDVNRDGSVMVDDYTEILNHVLEIETIEEGSMKYLAADVNEDGNVNIGDITGVTNIIIGNSNTGLRAAARYAAQQGGAGNIELATESDGDVTRVAVKINGSAAYVGAQMDIKLPAGVTLLSATSGSSEHNLYQNTLADGTQRVVVSSMQNSVLGTNGEAVVWLELTGKVDGNISIDNVFASDARGIAYSIDGTGNGTTGIDGLDANKSLKDKIYSVGGQMMKTLKKGVNILRGSDGSTKKVLRK